MCDAIFAIPRRSRLGILESCYTSLLSLLSTSQLPGLFLVSLKSLDNILETHMVQRRQLVCHVILR